MRRNPADKNKSSSSSSSSDSSSSSSSSEDDNKSKSKNNRNPYRGLTFNHVLDATKDKMNKNFAKYWLRKALMMCYWYRNRRQFNIYNKINKCNFALCICLNCCLIRPTILSFETGAFVWLTQIFNSEFRRTYILYTKVFTDRLYRHN